MVAILATCGVVLVAAAAELIHLRRVRRIGRLAFGPVERPAIWAGFAPLLRVASLAAICWGAVTLLFITPKVHKAGEIPEDELRHLILVLDVSPSMQLDDAGPSINESRRKRASDILESFFERMPIEYYRTTIVAVYTGAKLVVKETNDLEVVRNILNDLPMHHAFKVGDTNIFSGLEEAVKLAHPWPPNTVTVMLVSDGDTVPATGMPKMPASVSHMVVVGVGDPHAGKFIDGHQSRQDSSTLRQVAARLRGTYHNGNQLHLPTDLLKEIAAAGGKSAVEKLTEREYAMIACGVGSSIYAILPLLLHFLGTRWRPGVQEARLQSAA